MLGFYSVEENRRMFFYTYAKEHGFDASDTESWRSQSRQELLSQKVIFFVLFEIDKTKGANQIIAQHGSIPKALVELFPHMKQARAKFTFVPQCMTFISNSYSIYHCYSVPTELLKLYSLFGFARRETRFFQTLCKAKHL